MTVDVQGNVVLCTAAPVAAFQDAPEPRGLVQELIYIVLLLPVRGRRTSQKLRGKSPESHLVTIALEATCCKSGCQFWHRLMMPSSGPTLGSRNGCCLTHFLSFSFLFCLPLLDPPLDINGFSSLVLRFSRLKWPEGPPLKA